MRFLTSGLFGLFGASIVSALPSNQEQTNFLSVRPSLAKHYESPAEIPTEKYFRESSFHYHYDGRFANSTLSDEKVTPHLSALIRTYLETMASIGAETWIMHGTLLAWWWNQMIFPWDNDLDVQISEATIHFLADYYNMTEHHFDLPGVEGGRTYLLEINPHYVFKGSQDTKNVIDGRWIDMSSGLFIDITAVRPDDEKRKKGYQGALTCKDHHRYDESEIFPLRESYFEGVPVKIPYAYTDLLVAEYGPSSLTKTNFQGYNFNDETKIWEQVKRKLKRFVEILTR